MIGSARYVVITLAEVSFHLCLLAFREENRSLVGRGPSKCCKIDGIFFVGHGQSPDHDIKMDG